jgi:hypothetical protein
MFDSEAVGVCHGYFVYMLVCVRRMIVCWYLSGVYHTCWYVSGGWCGAGICQLILCLLVCCTVCQDEGMYAAVSQGDGMYAGMCQNHGMYADILYSMSG